MSTAKEVFLWHDADPTSIIVFPVSLSLTNCLQESYDCDEVWLGQLEGMFWNVAFCMHFFHAWYVIYNHFSNSCFWERVAGYRFLQFHQHASPAWFVNIHVLRLPTSLGTTFCFWRSGTFIHWHAEYRDCIVLVYLPILHRYLIIFQIAV